MIKEVAELEEENLIEVIYKLYQRHTELWELEDTRRDKSTDDHLCDWQLLIKFLWLIKKEMIWLR